MTKFLVTAAVVVVLSMTFLSPAAAEPNDQVAGMAGMMHQGLAGTGAK